MGGLSRFVQANGFVGSILLYPLRKKKIIMYTLVLSSLEMMSLENPDLIWLGKTSSLLASKENTERSSCRGVHHRAHKLPEAAKASCWERKRLCSQSKSQLKDICKYWKMDCYTLFTLWWWCQTSICNAFYKSLYLSPYVAECVKYD